MLFITFKGMRLLLISTCLWFLGSGAFAQLPSADLEAWYAKKDTDALTQWLENQTALLSTDREEQIPGSAQAEIYDLFEDIFTPYELTLWSPHIDKDDVYYSDYTKINQWGLNKFRAIQNEIAFAISPIPVPDSVLVTMGEDSLSFPEYLKKVGPNSLATLVYGNYPLPPTDALDTVVISDFRPRVQMPTNRRLYYSTELGATMHTFLLDYPGRQSYGKAKRHREDRKRFRFITKVWPLFETSWPEEGFYFFSSPEIEFVLLSPDFTRAIVKYRINYDGGYARCEKVEGEWKLVDIKTLWHKM